MAKGTGTRSGLLWEVERLLDECKDNLPQVLVLENVPQLVSQKHLPDFILWRRKLESLGYANFVQILNSKDYGIPQNRARCFMVSLLGDWHYTFPKKQKLELKLKDMLEEKVDEKYYLSDRAIKGFIAHNLKQAEIGRHFNFEPIDRERERERVRPSVQETQQEQQTTSSSNEVYDVKLAHGWNKGWVKPKEVIGTIDSGVGKWHTLIGHK